MPGKLIVIDGTDGSGKGTQTKILVEGLRKEGHEVVIADFPQYGQKSAGMVEEYLNGKFGSASEVTPHQASILYAVDRYAASFQMKKDLAAGKIIVSNRYTSANMGHQAGKIDNIEERDAFLTWLEELEFGILDIPKPDLNIFLYVDPEVSRNKALNVTKTNMDKSKDVHENDPEHMKKASEAFKYVAKKYHRTSIDCNAPGGDMRSIESISDDIWARVNDLLA